SRQRQMPTRKGDSFCAIQTGRWSSSVGRAAPRTRSLFPPDQVDSGGGCRDYQQEPSPTDVGAVRDDPDLDHPDYEGEYVIATLHTYRIRKDGQVELVGDTRQLLNLPRGRAQHNNGGEHGTPDARTTAN